MKKTSIKCFISGPMTDILDMNYPAFMSAEKSISNWGYEPINPARNFGGDKTLPYATYLRESIRQVLSLDEIDYVLALRGWEKSNGAVKEIELARDLGVKIMYETELKTAAEVLYPSPKPEVEPEKESILQEAERIVNGPRRKDYGHPIIQFRRLAKLWSGVLGIDITPIQVGLCLVQLKISRLMNSYTRDSAVDISGYAQCIDLVHQEMEKEEDEKQRIEHGNYS